MQEARPVQMDPLYVIFEQHLYNFQDSHLDRKTFIGNVLREYITYLRRLNIAVPKSLEEPILEELAHQIQSLLVKKIYGFLTIEDYQNKASVPVKRRAKARYKKLTRQAEKKAGA